MPKVGDRVIIEGTKIGNPRREGTLLGTVGPLINVRWSDGTVSLFKPGAGVVSYEPGRKGNGATGRPAPAPAKKPAGKAAPKAAKKPAAKAAAAKPAAKKPAAKKAAAKRKR